MCFKTLIEKISFTRNGNTDKKVNKPKSGNNSPITMIGGNQYMINKYLISMDIEYILNHCFFKQVQDDSKFNKELYQDILNWGNDFNSKLESLGIYLSKFKNEKRLKIKNFLASIVSDEEKQQKESSYIYDIEQIRDDPTYITLSDKLNFEQLSNLIHLHDSYIEITTSKGIIWKLHNYRGWLPKIELRTLLLLNYNEDMKLSKMEAWYYNYLNNNENHSDTNMKLIEDNFFEIISELYIKEFMRVDINYFLYLGLYEFSYIHSDVRLQQKNEPAYYKKGLVTMENVVVSPTEKMEKFYTAIKNNPN